MIYRIIFCILCLPILGYSQETPALPQPDSIPGDSYELIEINPVFPGGEMAYIRFIQENYHHPKIASQNGVDGTIYFSFIVDPMGNIMQVKILKGICKPCDEEAIRVVRSMPRWTPGTQGGKKVKVEASGRIRVTLNGASYTYNNPRKYRRPFKHYKAGRYKRAMKRFAKLILRYPNESAYKYGLALVYIKQGFDEKACELWDKIKDSSSSGKYNLLQLHCE